MTFVVTDGQLRSVDERSAAFGTTARALSISPAQSMTYEVLWRAQPALRTVIGFLARNVAQLGVDPYERLSATDRRKLGVDDHPLAAILERPLPGSKWTKYRLLNQLMHDLCLFDSAYWLKLKLDGQVRGVVPIPRRLIKPTGKSWLTPERYEIRGSRGAFTVEPEQVVHFHGYDPEDPRDGVPPIEALRQILSEEYAASAYREQLWRNGARVAGYIKRPADAPKWSEGAKARFANGWQAAYSGDGSEAGGTPVLEDGMEFHPAGVTPKDAQYVESRKLTREECAVAYYVQPVLMGLMDGANFGSVTEIHRWLYQDTLAPYLTQIGQDIENQLLDDLDPGASASGRIYVEFNLNEKLRGSFEQQAAAISSSVGGPWMTRDEARAMFNLGHIDGADELIVPMNVVTGGLASPRDTAPDDPDNGPSNGQPPKARGFKALRSRPPAGPMTKVMRAFFERQGRVLASRAGTAKSRGHGRKDSADDDLFDTERWDEELAADLQPVAVATAAKAGRATLAALDLDEDLYDPDRTQAWTAAHTAASATAINAVTRAALADAVKGEDPVAAVKDLFASYAEQRAELIGQTETAHMAGFGGSEALEQADVGGTKTWVTGANARADHAAMDGETVGHRDTFSNGARWPGDSTLDIDERAGCNCDIEWGTA